MTKTDVINMALGLIGVELIEHVGDGSSQGKLADTYYDQCVSELISLVDMHVCRMTAKPAVDLDYLEQTGEQRYLLPVNFVRPVRRANSYRYEITGRYLYPLDGGPAYSGEFVYYGVIDTGAFPSLMVRGVATMLASYLAVPLQDSLDKKNHFRQELQREIIPAIHKMERYSNPRYSDDLSETLLAGRGRRIRR